MLLLKECLFFVIDSVRNFWIHLLDGQLQMSRKYHEQTKAIWNACPRICISFSETLLAAANIYLRIQATARQTRPCRRQTIVTGPQQEMTCHVSLSLSLSHTHTHTHFFLYRRQRHIGPVLRN